MNDNLLKKGKLTKRAQGRSSNASNYKERLFVLTPQCLAYYAGEMKHLKFKTPVTDILGVEYCESQSRKYMFQVLHKQAVLYCVGSSETDREEWVQAIRKAIASNRYFSENFHSCIYDKRKGKWPCCNSVSRDENKGCKKCTPIDRKEANVVHRNSQIDKLENHMKTQPPYVALPGRFENGTEAPHNVRPAIPNTQRMNVGLPFSKNSEYKNAEDGNRLANELVPGNNSLTEKFAQTRLDEGMSETEVSVRERREIMKQNINVDNFYSMLNKFEVEVLHSYPQDGETGEKYPQVLPITIGDTLEILETPENGWWLARKLDNPNKWGYIPSNFVQISEDLASCIWFHGRMPKDTTTQTLRDQAEGTYIIRESETRPGQFSLGLKSKDGVEHWAILRANDQFYMFITTPKFYTLGQLVFYHSANRMGLDIRLRRSYREAISPRRHLEFVDNEIARDDITFLEKLGVGNFGVVYRGVFKNDIPVAIKQLKDLEKEESISCLDDFLDEAKVMKSLQHPCLVSLFAVVTRDMPYMIITEYMCNGSLLTYLQQNKYGIETEVLTYLCQQVAHGMAYLEANEYIHRDLAARNILVGNHYIVKIGDFGLTRFLVGETYMVRSTVLPVKWTAPEVWEYKEFSTASDVWSFAVLTWETFSWGIKPYPDKNNKQVRLAVKAGHRMAKPEKLSDNLYQLLLRCWMYDRHERPRFSEILQIVTEELESYPGWGST